ncbi:MAG: GNAT family N-acetyltransferase [Alphaproteobacteria bacterium]|nr:GNAT family N-acetyltransferase [Alphaproteobacteria bacterium]
MEEADANSHYARWMNDSDIVRYTESRYTTHSIDGIHDYIAAMRRDPDSLLLAMETKNDRRHIGNIKIGPVDWYHRSGDIGLLIGEADCWGQGYASEAIAALAGYAFAALGLEKLTAGVYEPNTGCIRAFERAGFIREGVRRNQYRFENGRVDVVLLGRASGADV